MTKCSNCNRSAQTDSEYCWYCDPTVPQHLKDESRRRGGANSRKFPLAVQYTDLPPANSAENLRIRLEGIQQNLWERSNSPSAARVLKEINEAILETFVFEKAVQRLEMIKAQLESGESDKAKVYLEAGTWLDEK